MKHLLIFFCLLFAFSTLNAQCYQQVWADEFNGTSLDLTKWTPIVGEGGAVSGNAELQYYTARPQNIQVSGGTLKIIALLEDYGITPNHYTSARLQTKNLGDWLYGKFEARIKLPIGKGMWPAFWMMPTDNVYGVWPQSGEMDIMELIGREPSNAYATIHTGSFVNDDHGFGSRYTLPSGTFADDFHIFSMEWSPNLLKFYVDGNLYTTLTPSSVSPYPWVFDKRFFILLNLAIGGPWALAPDGTTTFPQTMEVDYVRVYQKIQDLAITGKTLVETNTPSVSYTIPSMAGVTYQWSVTNGTITSGQGTAQITVNWVAANGTVSVTMNDGCTPSAAVSTPVTVTPNLWDNYGFEQNYVSWDTRPAFSPTATFSISNSDFTEGVKAACVTTNTVGVDPWNIQLSRINLNLVGGTSYTLHFNAKSSVNQTIHSSFIRHSNYSTIADHYLNLTNVWKPFSLTFTPSSNEYVMWNADLAAQLGTICFDDFSFARATILPIELIDFQGIAEKKGNRLICQFGDTKDLDMVEIQKCRDGKFSVSNIVGGIVTKDVGGGIVYNVGGGVVTRDRKFSVSMDETPFDITYYRLKITNIDGTTSFSKTIAVKRSNTEGGKITVYPNPVSKFIDIETELIGDFQVINLLGQQILFGKSTQRIDVSTLPQGTYFLKIDRKQTKFVKQ